MTETLSQASVAVDAAGAVVGRASEQLADRSRDGDRISVARLDEHQVLAYDLAHAAAAVEGSRVMLEYAQHGEIESLLARAYIADAVSELAARLVGRAATWGSGIDALAAAMPFVEEHRSPAFLVELGDQVAAHGTGPSHLSDDFELV